MRRVLGPLRSGATLRRGVYLLLGGVVLLPYVLLALAEYRMLRDPDLPRAITIAFILLTAAIGAVPAFLGATRELEITAARLLLGVDLPDPPAEHRAGDRRAAWETRLRAALWFAVHLLAGGAVGLLLLAAAPLALVTLLTRTGPLVPVLAALGLADLGTVRAVSLTVLGLVMLVGIAYLVAALGLVAAMMAPVLLGPSATERIAALEADARRLAERNRLARELHDSVGHALTVTVLQAAAAGQVLDHDPAFVRRALTAIEESGRAAMEDLDRVLGVLRDDRAGRPPAPAVAARTLHDLPRLLTEVTATDRPVTLTSCGEVGQVPASLSREGYRLVQEGLTNALRHAPGAPVTLSVAVDDDRLTIEVVNPLPSAPAPAPAAAPEASGGVGIAGMRERMTLLGGRLEAGPDGARWRMRAELPL